MGKILQYLFEQKLIDSEAYPEIPYGKCQNIIFCSCFETCCISCRSLNDILLQQKEKSLLLCPQLLCFCSKSCIRLLSHMAMNTTSDCFSSVPTHFFFTQLPHEMSGRSLNVPVFFPIFSLINSYLAFGLYLLPTEKDSYLQNSYTVPLALRGLERWLSGQGICHTWGKTYVWIPKPT